MTDDLEIWLADPAGLDEPDRHGAAIMLLDDDERARMGRYHFERDQRLHLASHALLRLTLSRHAAVAPAAWRYGAEATGRPVLAGPAPVPPLRFNLSHAVGLVACAVTEGRDIGVDVEAIGPVPEDLITSVFTPAEVAALRALPAARQAERFFTLWTLKEAYVKARGDGLSLPLQQIVFHFDGAGEGGDARFDPGPALGDAADRWTFARLRPTPAHCAAVCVARTPGAAPATIRPRWLSWP